MTPTEAERRMVEIEAEIGRLAKQANEEISAHEEAIRVIRVRLAQDSLDHRRKQGKGWLRWRADAVRPGVETVSGKPAVFLGVSSSFGCEPGVTIRPRGRADELFFQIIRGEVFSCLLERDGMWPRPSLEEYQPKIEVLRAILAGHIPAPIGEAPAPDDFTPPPDLETP